MNKTVLTFLAHPDDAEMLCVGTLIRLSELGWDVHIATSVMGDCGSATLQPDEIARIRHTEATAAAELIGATYHCMGERDVHLVFDHDSNRKAIDLFREIAPSLVLTHPRMDYMLDHEQTHLLARSAAFAYSIPNASTLPLKEGSTVPHLYYCDPIDAIDPTGNVVEPTTLVDVTDQMERKTQMLACHASQRDWLRAHHGMDEYVESMKRHSALRGRLAGTTYAEAFIQHRGHAFPSNDLLNELMSGISG
jgi:LmbE family N-acetylglucosaminyl deacetylase